MTYHDGHRNRDHSETERPVSEIGKSCKQDSARKLKICEEGRGNTCISPLEAGGGDAIKTYRHVTSNANMESVVVFLECDAKSLKVRYTRPQ